MPRDPEFGRRFPPRSGTYRTGGVACSRTPGHAVGDIAYGPDDGDIITVVSLYGIWAKMPAPGQLFADATLHRAIADLAVVFQQRHPDKILVAGDLNVWHGYGDDGWRDRYMTVVDRLEAHGLGLIGPSAPTAVPH
jgi:hypothetical protein